MSEASRPLRKKVLARRRRTLAISISVVVLALGSVIVLGIVTAKWLDARETMHVYLQGSGVDRLQPGSRVALGVQEIGQVATVELREGAHTAHLVMKRDLAGELPGTSAFQVESLNHWMPGNLGVRVYLPKAAGGAEPLADDVTILAQERFLPPETPVRFYYLIAVAVLVVAVTIAIAVVAARWINRLATLAILACGILALLAVYAHFSGQITAPELPGHLADYLAYPE
jgi:hypothetical protein